MEKIVRASIVSRSFGRILKDVETNGDKIVVERNGQAAAAIVPIAVYEQWKQRREAFFDKVKAASAQAQVRLSPEQAEDLGVEAIKAARKRQT